MLEEKLKQANNAREKRWKKVLLFLVAVLSLGGILAVFFLAVDHAPDIPPSTQVVEKVMPPVLKKQPETTAQLSEFRQEFIGRLQRYEEGLEVAISDANLESWNAGKKQALASLKESAIEAFSAADYASALTKIVQLESEAKETLTERDTLFAEAMAAALKALAADDVTKVELYVTKALLIKPDDQQAQTVARKLNVLPELLDVLKKVNVARIENNNQKEYSLLIKAIKLSPDRQGLQQRRDVLWQSIKEKRFRGLISHALLAVEKQNFNTARSDYKKAKVLYPGRLELRKLNKIITQTSRALQLKELKLQAKKAMANDDWFKAESLYAKGIQDNPLDNELRDGLQLAGKVASLQTDIRKYLEQPERLSSENIFAEAQNTLIQANVFSRNSPTLAQLAVQLKNLLKKVSIKIPVLVKSDNETYILVKGVGKVGKTLSRTIELKAGDYIFEGSRPGYQSKWVRVHLSIDAPSFEVEVICDERI